MTFMNDNLNPTAFVVFSPSGQRGSFPIGTPILQAARTLGVDIDSICGGWGLCGRCQIEVQEGNFSKHQIISSTEHLSPPADTELKYIARKKLPSSRRLSCSTQILGDLVIDVPRESQTRDQVVRKRPEIRDIVLNQSIRLYYVEVEEPNLYRPSGDIFRLKEALKSQWDLQGLACDLKVLQKLQATLREGEWKVTVAIYEKQHIISIWPGFHEKYYGLAVDVGTTTIAAHLCDMNDGQVLASAGMMNPQIRYGEDLMSRVSYIMMNPDGEKALVHAVRDAINSLAGQTADEAGIEVTDILQATFAANTIMHHLLLGINPVELGWAPFSLATHQPIKFCASELELKLHPGARCYTLPCIAGHVGADTAGVILSESPHTSEKMTLLVDVGTNAEIVLGNKDRLIAASSPTGPAFEGAQISSGQRAAPGAIERVRIDPKTLEPKFKVIGSDFWSDEDGFSNDIKNSGITGICGSGIIEVVAELFLCGIVNEDGVIEGAFGKRTDRVILEGRTYSYLLHQGDPDEKPILITQNDIRAIQLAKAALYAGIRLLMDKMGVDSVERIRLAGAFGSHIDVKYAMILGLLPDCDLAQVEAAGNAAGTGARIALLDFKACQEIEEIVNNVEKIETALEKDFQNYFVEAMAIPHKTAHYPHLSKVVTLPLPKKMTDSGHSVQGRPRTRRRARIRSTENNI
ncbi:MAG: DUF4445 domain-containing protein [SAR324 cluster bacterium]|nr:DUF4445 domain-containing protein [SAR324 cluster bacterium]